MLLFVPISPTSTISVHLPLFTEDPNSICRGDDSISEHQNYHLLCCSAACHQGFRAQR